MENKIEYFERALADFKDSEWTVDYNGDCYDITYNTYVDTNDKAFVERMAWNEDSTEMALCHRRVSTG